MPLLRQNFKLLSKLIPDPFAFLWTSGSDFYTKPHNRKNISICFTALDSTLKIGYNVLKHTTEGKNTIDLM